MHQARALKAVRMLDLLTEFFDGGRRWTQMRLEDPNGNRCLVGALRHLGAAHRLNAAWAEAYLVEAIPPALKERVGLIGFNDTRQRNYRDVLQRSEDARTLACADAAQPAKRRPAKPPADRQRHSAVIHAGHRRALYVVARPRQVKAGQPSIHPPAAAVANPI